MPPPGDLTVRRVADLVDGEVVGSAETIIAGIAPLETAGPGDLAFLANPRYLAQFRTSRAGAVLVSRPLATVDAGPATRVIVEDAREALARLLPAFEEPHQPHWRVDRRATLGRGTTWQGRIAIDAGVVIGCNVTIGSDCRIAHNTVIEDGVHIGDRCRIGPSVTIHRGCRLGDDVSVGAGARIGSDGFAYVSSPEDVRWVPHVARCRVGNGVRVGSNTTIDRGTIRDTIVGDQTKIDNLVHIAHNVQIGQRCIIMAQVGIAGSVTVRDEAVLAGQAGIADHLTIGRGARVAAQGGVIGDIPDGVTVSGYPARHHRSVLRQAAALSKLPAMINRLESLTAGDESR